MAVHKPNSSRYLIVVITIAIVLLYMGRLFYLQVLTPSYKERADSNAFYQKPIYPARGVIYDRDGDLLVYNKPTYDLMVTIREVENLDTLDLCHTLKVEPDILVKRLVDVKNRKLNPGYSPFVPQVLISQIEAPEAGRFQEKLYKYPGFYIRSRTLREYEYHHAAHLLGSLAEANPKDLEQDSSLVAGDYVGKTGVEKSYEHILRGEKGVNILLRDARGRIKGRYQNGQFDKAPVPGQDITLSIDKDLQALGEELMQGKRGAIVAIEPATGEILCMVSAPSYDPALLAGKERGNNHRILEQTPGKPLYARAIMGTYPPGSTFKTSQGAIFLQEGVLSSSSLLSCYHGFPPLHNRPACHGHGSPLPLVPALATSCNAYFCWGLRFMLDNRQYYPTVQQAFEKWKDYIVRMGFGYKLDVDLPSERRGYIPNSKVYDKVYKGKWNSSSIISIAIGQGEILATPVQLANLASIVANRGHYYKPHIVKLVGQSPADTLYSRRRDTGISADIWEKIAEGMAMAVLGGTCKGANFAPGEITVCGKTGTAENPHGKDHSAFIGFAPKESPRIAVAVYVENGGFGATFGVPIGRLIMEYYLKGELSPGAMATASNIKQTKIFYHDDVYRHPTLKSDTSRMKQVTTSQVKPLIGSQQ
ncbi:penicillin-binding transpeptidase domain-containing protein [Porphyromonas crevioricanis]|uniref:penicillin-binding transpeptidase domain-containing protein n=1 Tax=Porphyromonas crevioricanis TaxID=393921 RepID=UPI0009DDD0C4|nr:penicillin-binding transpeptidase domain-containing protein [Porphyromonas crevioricanis]